MRGPLPQTGVELKLGIPGSGKSYILTKRVIEAITVHRRPVYTNLPLRWPVVRRYLRNRGGEDLVRLLHVLTEDHFVAFMERFERWRQWKDQLRGSGRVISREAQRDAWFAEAGCDNATSNWIPPGALVVIDEVHHWFPNPALKSVRKPEPPSLMSYLTMHRHMGHLIWMATQDERQVSTTIKSLAHKVWVIHRMDEKPLAWGIKFKHLGLRSLGYTAFTPDQNRERDKPVENFVVLVNVPWNVWVFRLYESFSHGGTRRELAAGLRQAQLEAGLDERGRMKSEVEAMAKRRPTVLWRFISFWLRWLRRGLVTAALLGLGVFVGRMSRPKAVDVEAGPVAVQSVEPDRGVVLRSMRPGVVRFSSGDSVELGGVYRGLELEYVDVRAKMSVWLDRAADEYWLWSVGKTARKLGPTGEVLQRVEAASRSRGGSTAAVDDAIPPRGPGAGSPRGLGGSRAAAGDGGSGS